MLLCPWRAPLTVLLAQRAPSAAVRSVARARLCLPGPGRPVRDGRRSPLAALRVLGGPAWVWHPGGRSSDRDGQLARTPRSGVRAGVWGSAPVFVAVRAVELDVLPVWDRHR